jgi:hypothetical protein
LSGNHLRAANRNDGNRLEPILMPLQDATAEKMLNNVAEFIAATLAKPDQRAWDQLLIYCPREAIARRAAAIANGDR